MITGILLFLSQMLPSFLGLAKAKIERDGDEARAKHRERLQELENDREIKKAEKQYQRDRLQAIRTVMVADKGWSPINIIRFGFSLPFMILTNVTIYAYLITGEWHNVENMPPIMQQIWAGAGAFVFMFEAATGYQRREAERDMLTDPAASSLVANVMSDLVEVRRSSLVKGQ